MLVGIQGDVETFLAGSNVSRHAQASRSRQNRLEKPWSRQLKQRVSTKGVHEKEIHARIRNF